MKIKNYTADACPCSLEGCQSLWPCSPSRLCYQRDPPVDDDAAGTPQHERVTFLFFLAFNASLVRNVFAAHPKRARDREVNRVLWFAHTARIVRTRLPIHAVVAGEPLDATHETRLRSVGVRLLTGPLIPTPAWASKWHRLSFNKIAALSLCVFDTPHFS